MNKNHYDIKTIENGYEIHFGTDTKIQVFNILPGIMLAYKDVHDPMLPAADFGPDDCLCTIHYALSGTCSLMSTEGRYIYLRAGNLMLSLESVSSKYEYPAGAYTGIEIYIMKKAAASGSLLPKCGIDIKQLIPMCFKEFPTIIAENNYSLQSTFSDMDHLLKQNFHDIHLLTLHTLYILRILSTGKLDFRPGYDRALTKNQVDIAHQTAKMIHDNPSEKHTISDIAAIYYISPTSLKNYFRAVYGKSISDYRTSVRMELAEHMLVSSDRSICVIAHSVGYENQSKFTAAFRRKYGMTPSQYRMRKKINQQNQKR